MRLACCRDAEVKEEGFLEYINQLLMTGEVAGLLPKEELDALLNDVRPAFKRENIGVLLCSLADPGGLVAWLVCWCF